MNGRLWAFSGLDGSGKSTQIDLLLAELTARGLRGQRVWARGGYTPLFDLLKTALRRLNQRSLPPPVRSAEREQKFRSPLVRRTWLVIAMLDLFLYYGVWVRGLRWMGCHVVADRWVEDTMLDFRMNFPNEDAAHWPLWRLVCRATPRPDVHFVFVIPVEESLRRSRQKDEPFPDSAETLRQRSDFYRGMLAKGGAWEMDGMKSREEMHAEVLRICGLAPA